MPNPAHELAIGSFDWPMSLELRAIQIQIQIPDDIRARCWLFRSFNLQRDSLSLFSFSSSSYLMIFDRRFKVNHSVRSGFGCGEPCCGRFFHLCLNSCCLLNSYSRARQRLCSSIYPPSTTNQLQPIAILLYSSRCILCSALLPQSTHWR